MSSAESLHSPELSLSSPTTPATPSYSPLERGRTKPIPLLTKEGLGEVAEEKVASISPTLHSVESLRNSLPESYQSLFDTLRREVIDFCDLHSIPTSSLHNDEALREATKHLSLLDLAHLSLVLKRLDYLVTHKEPMPEERAIMNEEQAREIMGENFLGTHEVEEHFGELSDEQQESLSNIPFFKETLEACRETHILVADIGIPLLDIRKIKTTEKLFNDQDWYDNEDFAKRTEAVSWRLIRKTPVENSFDKTWDEQQFLVKSRTNEVPTTRQLVYTIILHCLVTRERLFETRYVRTCDVESDGHHVYIGCFDNGGLVVNGWFNSLRRASLGMASARKFDPRPLPRRRK